ncbi:hypothetical protein [Thiohalocapsa halophila]|nr:hypothetical protein [Thiohalocapsa halophila]
MADEADRPSLTERLGSGACADVVQAHFPAHQGRLTSVAGLCAEHLPRDVPYLRRSTLRDAEDRLADQLGVRASLLLTNGASQGLLAACLALGRRTRRVAVAGDCHVAVSRGLVLADLAPEPIPSRRASPSSGEVLNFLAGDPPPAMILPAPTYRGERLDLAAIAERCLALGVDLVVDEVHGSQLRGLPSGPGSTATSALDLPCTLVVHSAHKYAGALVQGAVLHVPQGSRLDPDHVRDALDLIDTTSRSNLIQASVEAALHAGLPGGALHDAMLALTERVANLAAELDAAADPALWRDPACADPRKLVLRSDNTDGFDLARRLLAAGLDHEYANVDEVLLVFSPAHEEADFARAADALHSVRAALSDLPQSRAPALLAMPERRFATRPRAAWLAGGETLPLAAALGRTARAPVASETPDLDGLSAPDPERPDPRLPPGTATLLPGEVIGDWHLRTLGAQRLVSVVDDAAEAGA